MVNSRIRLSSGDMVSIDREKSFDSQNQFFFHYIGSLEITVVDVLNVPVCDHTIACKTHWSVELLEGTWNRIHPSNSCDLKCSNHTTIRGKNIPGDC